MGDGENSKTLLWHVFQVLGQDGVVICPVCRFIIVDFRGPIGMCFSSAGEGGTCDWSYDVSSDGHCVKTHVGVEVGSLMSTVVHVCGPHQNSDVDFAHVHLLLL